MRRAVLLFLMLSVLLGWLVRGEAVLCQNPSDQKKPARHLPAGALEQVSPANEKQGKAAATATALSGEISGVVTDAAGAAIAGVTVVVTNNATGEKRTTTTDSSGRYQFPNLPVADYTVAFSGPGLETVVMNHVVATMRQRISVPVRMSRTVSAKPPFTVGTGSVGVPEQQARREELPKAAESKPPVTAMPPPVPETAEIMKGHPSPKDGESSESVPALPPAGAAAPEAEKTAPKEDEASRAVADENKKFEDWHKHLPYGLSEHHVEPLMRLGQPSTVTFTIHGPNAPAFTPEEGTAPDKLQVSPKMSVFLTQPANPGAFAIVDGDSSQNPKRVAPDGVTTWTWFVTPQRLGTLKLHVEAFVLYGNSSDDRASYSSYNDTIKVQSVTLWGYLGSGITWVLQNPGESLKYVLPGGGGAVILGAVIQWVRKRRKKGRSAHKDLPD